MPAAAIMDPAIRPARSPRPAAGTGCPVTASATPVRSRYGVIPPRWNGQPAPEDHAQVDVLRLGDDAVVEHEPRLLGEGAEGPLADLLLGQRDRRPAAAAPWSRRRRTGGRARPSCRCPARPASTSRRRFSDTWYRAGNAACRVSRDVQRDGRADELQQDERRHRQAERRQRAVGDLDGRALVDGPRHLAEEPGEEPVDDEGRRVLDEHAGLLELLADGERRRERGVVGALGRGRPRPAAAPRPG